MAEVSDKIIPRAYQEEIFQAACKENIICASPTGEWTGGLEHRKQTLLADVYSYDV